MNKTLSRIVQILVLIGIIFSIAWKIKPHDVQSPDSAVKMDFLSRYFDEEFTIQSDTVNNIYTLVQKQQTLGYVLLSSDLEKQTRGFADVIDFAVVLSKDLSLLGIEIVASKETPSYIKYLKKEGFFEQFKDMKVDALISFTPDLVTGATMSSNAIATDLKSVLVKVGDIKNTPKHLNRMMLMKNGAAFLLLAFSLLHFFFPKKMAKTRLVLLMLSIVILGIWCGYFLSLAVFKSWLINGVVLQMQAAMFGIFILSVFLPLFTRKDFYCTYVCPFGAMQELAGKISTKKVSFPKPVKAFLRWTRFGVLVIIFILLFIGLDLPLSDMEPFSLMQFRAASLFVLILASFMIVLSVFIAKPWCRYFCPTGMFLSLFRKPVFYRKKD